jgi:hypothetical protein
MKSTNHTIRHHLTAALLALVTLTMATACHTGPLNTLTQANLDQVQPNMTSAQVKTILGEPTATKDEPIPIVGGTKTTYTYDNNQDHIVIVLKNDSVQTKEGTFAPAQ